MNARPFPLTLLVGMVLLLSACRAQPAALSDEAVTQVTTDLLTALSAGRQEDFVRDFSDDMRALFMEEAQFTALRTMLQETSGNFISCAAPSLFNRGDYAVYRLRCRFEQEDVMVTVVFKVDGDRVEGLYFDSPNLRARNRQAR
jgi:hypothetical protein